VEALSVIGSRPLIFVTVELDGVTARNVQLEPLVAPLTIFYLVTPLEADGTFQFVGDIIADNAKN
jgi:hypothetical protein